MPIHDWTRVDAGVFHDFHNVWIGLLRNALNSGILPSGFYARSEQHVNRRIADILTLEARSSAAPAIPETGGVAVSEAPPRLTRQAVLAPSLRSLRKTLTIRHTSGHRIVALLEIVSPRNKDRCQSVEAFVDKAEDTLRQGIHLVLVDLFPPELHDPEGIYGMIQQRFCEEAEGLPGAGSLTVASYAAADPIQIWAEHLQVGDALPDVPLFLTPERYVDLPLESTYAASWDGTPQVWRDVLSAGTGS